MLETALGQNTYDPSSWSNRSIWLFFMMATFLAIVGVLLNLMSTDQVAQIQAQRIDSLDDLLSNDFDHYQPVVIKSLYVYTLMVTAKPETKIGKLYGRIMRNEEIGVIPYNGTNFTDIMRASALYDDAIAGFNYTFVMSRHGYEGMLKPMQCTMKPKFVSGMYQSKESFGGGMLVSFFNKLMDSELHRYLRYQLMTYSEMGLGMKFGADVAAATVGKFGGSVDHETMVCNCGLTDEDNYEQMVAEILLEFEAVRGTVIVCFFLVFIASIALASELILCGLKSISKSLHFKYLARRMFTYGWNGLICQFRSIVSAVWNLWHQLCERYSTRPEANTTLDANALGVRKGVPGIPDAVVWARPTNRTLKRVLAAITYTRSTRVRAFSISLDTQFKWLNAFQ